MSYIIYAASANDPLAQVGTTTDLSNLSFQLSIPANKIGHTFRFTVSAVNEVGEGLQSAATSIIAGILPSAPLGLAKVSADVGQITFSWNAPADDGGVPILDYQIYFDNALNAGMTLLVASTGVVSQWSTSGTITAQNLVDGAYY